MASPLLVVGVARSAGAATTLPVAGVVMAKHDRFCRELSKALSVEVGPLWAKSYSELSEGVEQGRVALAWLPPIIAHRLSIASRALPIAMPVRSGSSTFCTALFARADGPTSLEQLNRARVAWVERFSASGYSVVRAALRARGHALEKLFGVESFIGSHQGVARAVLDGTVEVGATYYHKDPTGKIVNPGWGTAKVNLLMEFGPVPADVLAAGTQLSTPMIQQIQRALLDASQVDLRRAACELFEAEAFVRADPSHLAALAPLLVHFDSGNWGGSRMSQPPPR
jgi:phosphonate transport system substrate-binding protein